VFSLAVAVWQTSQVFTLSPFAGASTTAKLHPQGQRGQRASRILRNADMAWHARDPKGVKHSETILQSRRASTIKSLLADIFARCEVSFAKIGDEDFQRRLRIDDVIMTRGCRSAYVHIAAAGGRLEQRQAFVWLARNKGGVKTALAKRMGRRQNIPALYFVESKFDDWDEQFRQARRYPELNMPDPYQFNPNWVPNFMKKAHVFKKMTKEERFQSRVKRRQGLGDETKPFPPWGYPQ